MSGEPPAARLLVTGPPGSGKSRRALEAFDAGLDRDGPDRALLVLPTYGEVEHQKRLAISRREERRDARAILDVSYATFTSLGERLVPGFRVRALPSRRERDLLAEEALRRAAVPAFEAVRDRPGFRARFLRLVKEMKQTGLEPAALRARAQAALADLGRDAPAAAERFGGFLLAWEAYDGLLAASGCHDHEDVLRDLVAKARAGTTGLAGLSVLVVDGFEDLSGVEAALLHAASDAVTTGGGPRRRHAAVGSRAAPALRGGRVAPRSAARAARVRRGAHDRVRARRGPGARAPRHLALRRGRARGRAARRPARPGTTCARSWGPTTPTRSTASGARSSGCAGRSPTRCPRSATRASSSAVSATGGPTARRALEALGIPARLVGPGARLTSEALVRALRGPLRLLAGDDGAPGSRLRRGVPARLPALARARGRDAPAGRRRGRGRPPVAHAGIPRRLGDLSARPRGPGRPGAAQRFSTSSRGGAHAPRRRGAPPPGPCCSRRRCGR